MVLEMSPLANDYEGDMSSIKKVALSSAHTFHIEWKLMITPLAIINYPHLSVRTTGTKATETVKRIFKSPKKKEHLEMKHQFMGY